MTPAPAATVAAALGVDVLWYALGRVYLVLAKFLPGANPLAAGLAGAVPLHPAQFLLYAAAGAVL